MKSDGGVYYGMEAIGRAGSLGPDDWYEFFTPEHELSRVRYGFRDKHGIEFSCEAATLSEAIAKRDEWLQLKAKAA